MSTTRRGRAAGPASHATLSAAATGFSASPWAYNGKVFAISEDGETFVMQAGRRFALLGQNRLDELTLATPAIADDTLYVRTETKLFAFKQTR